MPLVHLLFRLPSKLRRRARRTRMNVIILLFLLFCCILAPLHLIYKPPGFVISYLQYRWPEVLWRVHTRQKLVALTIDDAPSEHTDAILAVLTAYESTATFFTIGSQIKGREPTLRRLITTGNELANHAMYDEPSISLSDEVLAEQIQTISKQLDTFYVDMGLTKRRRYFRPGSGFFNDRMLRNVAKQRHRLVLGNVYPHDPQIPYYQINAAHILSMVCPGSIIICHDRRDWTVPMLLMVLPELKKQGYSIVTVTELLDATEPV